MMPPFIQIEPQALLHELAELSQQTLRGGGMPCRAWTATTSRWAAWRARWSTRTAR